MSYSIIKGLQLLIPSEIKKKNTGWVWCKTMQMALMTCFPHFSVEDLKARVTIVWVDYFGKQTNIGGLGLYRPAQSSIFDLFDLFM